MEHSTLKPLLPELRLRIYHLVLWDPNPITIDFDYYGRCTRIGGQHHLLALTETCRFIRNEALPEFYAYNNFLALIGNLAGTAGFNDVHPPRYEGGIPRFRQWLEEIGFENAKRIRRIEIQSFLRTNTSALVNPRLASRLLRPVTDFFAGTGAQADFTLEVELQELQALHWPGAQMTFDKLPLDDLRATRLEARNICRQHVASWAQSYSDGGITLLDVQFWTAAAGECEQMLEAFFGQVRLWPDIQSSLFLQERTMEKTKKSKVVVLKMPAGGADKVIKKKEEELARKKMKINHLLGFRTVHQGREGSG